MLPMRGETSGFGGVSVCARCVLLGVGYVWFWGLFPDLGDSAKVYGLFLVWGAAGLEAVKSRLCPRRSKACPCAQLSVVLAFLSISLDLCDACKAHHICFAVLISLVRLWEFFPYACY